MANPITLTPVETSALAGGARGDQFIDHALQFAILLLSAAAIGLIAQPAPLQGWGFVVGLVSQPAWFVATWRKRQWGMFALSFFYTGAWVQGIVNHF
jgi:hypothetical protein